MRGCHENVAQFVHVAVDRGDSFLVGFEVALVIGEQIAAQTGFGIQHVLQQQTDGSACVVDMGQIGQGIA
ncbi:hypothetical protein D3C80_1873530 [compost metagenome]